MSEPKSGGDFKPGMREAILSQALGSLPKERPAPPKFREVTGHEQFSREYYTKQLAALRDRFGTKLEEEELGLLNLFLATRDPSTTLLYAGVSFFNALFFAKVQQAIDVELDDDYNAFRTHYKKPQEVKNLLIQLLGHEKSHKRAKTAESVQPKTQAPDVESKSWFDTEKAKEFGLSMERLAASEQANELVHRLHYRDDQFLDATDPRDVQVFFEKWMKTVAQIAPPGVPPEAIWKQIHKHTPYPLPDVFKSQGLLSFLNATNAQTYRRDEFGALPQFGAESTVFVENWTEADVLSEERPPQVTSNILKALGRDGKVYSKMTYYEVVDLLWEGWRDNHKFDKRTENHKKIIKELGLSDQFYIRLIAYDEYLRLAPKYGFGKKKQLTMMSDSLSRHLRGGPERFQATTGKIHTGSISGVQFAARGKENFELAPRFVIAKATQGIRVPL